MPSLLACIGHDLARAVDDLMIMCRGHGPAGRFQPSVIACPCVASEIPHWPHPAGGGLPPIDGGGARVPPAVATMDGVYCADHLARLEADDPDADDELIETCFQCLVDSGVLPIGAP